MIKEQDTTASLDYLHFLHYTILMSSHKNYFFLQLISLCFKLECKPKLTNTKLRLAKYVKVD